MSDYNDRRACLPTVPELGEASVMTGPGPRLPDPAAPEWVRLLGSTGRAYASQGRGRRGRV